MIFLTSFLLTNDIFEHILFFKGVPFFFILGRYPIEKREQIFPLFSVPFGAIGTYFLTTWEQNGHLLLQGEIIALTSESRTEQIGP